MKETSVRLKNIERSSGGGIIALVCVYILAFSVPRAVGGRKQTLHGYVLASVISRAQAIGPLPDTTLLNLQIGLSLRNQAGLDNLLREIYDPASPDYRNYLTPDRFTEMFGPTQKDYQAVIDFMHVHGFDVTGTYANRLVVDVRGSAAIIDSTFHVTIYFYRDASKDHTFYAPDVSATIDGLDVPLLDVIGLDDFAPPRPIDLREPRPGEKAETTGSGPGGLFIGNDYRAAYASGVSLKGTGQIVGLFEFGPYWTTDITAYENQAGILPVKITNVLLDGFTGVPASGEDVGEESLDIENALAMAPGCSMIVYEGNSAVDILSRIASDDKAKQISCSFGWYPPSSTENSLYKQLDVQGQAFFAASGDGGAYAVDSTIFSPTDNPDIISVGGTSLTTTGPGGPWASETAWNGSGGGISPTFLTPNYQIGIGNSLNQGSRTYRNIPDMAATAAFQFYFVYNDGKTGGIGGTSGAAPLWAGFTALANQQAVAHGGQALQRFTITYADTTSVITQNFSDWFSPADYPDENTAVTMPYRDTGAGGRDNNTSYLYGYAFKLDPSRTAESVTLPLDQNLEILAMTLAAPVTDTAFSVNTFQLQQNFPNPFNLSTKIPYTLTAGAFVTLKIYDVLGREVETLVNGRQGPGSYLVTFSGENLASGVYFCRFNAGSFVATRKLVLLK